MYLEINIRFYTSEKLRTYNLIKISLIYNDLHIYFMKDQPLANNPNLLIPQPKYSFSFYYKRLMLNRLYW